VLGRSRWVPEMDPLAFGLSCPHCFPTVQSQPAASLTEGPQTRDGAGGRVPRGFPMPCSHSSSRRVLVLQILLIARVYLHAFIIAITRGAQARASVFAAYAYEVKVICVGEDCQDALMWRRDLKENPANLVEFGVSKRWRQARRRCRKGWVLLRLGGGYGK